MASALSMCLDVQIYNSQIKLWQMQISDALNISIWNLILSLIRQYSYYIESSF